MVVDHTDQWTASHIHAPTSATILQSEHCTLSHSSWQLELEDSFRDKPFRDKPLRDKPLRDKPISMSIQYWSVTVY